MAFAGTRRRDGALAVVAAAGLLVEGLVRAKTGVWPGAYLLCLASAVPLAWRTEAPLPVLLAVEAGATACVFAFDASFTAFAIVLVMLFTVAVHGDRVRSVVVGALTAIAVALIMVLIDGTLDLGGAGARVAFLFASLALGDTVRSRHALRAAAREREAREAGEREQESRRQIVSERVRIARELHDTLAHALVAINVRAGVADHLRDSQDSATALRDIKAVSATALGDLRATLSLLRDPDDAAPTGPALDLGALSSLTDHARAAGLQADLDLQVNGAVIPSAVGQAAFRIVQEALTNVLRHADASSARVRVQTISDALDIEILDDGRGRADCDAEAGHGLRGMAERATALGGRVQAGPRQEAGWRVHAVLPLAQEARR